MSSTLEEVCAEVLKRVTPTTTERKQVLSLAKKLVEKVKEGAKEKGVETEVRVEGSVAKNTWLRDCPEIDVFMRVPTTMPREAFGTVCLEIAKKATEGYKQIERFAEHPYLEAVIDNVWVNIVPCYRVKRGEWLSATDRTPFHTDYVKPLLDEQKSGEVRLLKRFMKGVDVYGAEIKVGGFSGYLCELLVLNYGSFIKVLKAAADWKERTIIDYEGHYKRKDDAKELFEEPFIMVDPVDKRRNVAAAVRKERLDEFIAASRAFLKAPDLKFFYPPQIEALESTELVNRINARGSTSVFISFRGGPAVPDVLWGQLYKSQRALRKLIQQHDFTVLRDTVWSNEKNLNTFIFEVENRFLPNMKRHLGPPLRKKRECENFLRKHVGADSTVSGPRVEEGRWVVDVQRRHTDVVKLLNEKLEDSGASVGLAEFVSKAVADSLEVMVKDEALKLYSAYPDFAKFLTEYLTGKPRWLT
ncbi:MAG TPA: CCA tRNA nucleotidyltransferase [Candidatus Bathyarchaeota archaeon]|nr:CCA tRNA nucleotidyltransferase [Candidatus Bathyarchaeota archaeon]